MNLETHLLAINKELIQYHKTQLDILFLKTFPKKYIPYKLNYIEDCSVCAMVHYEDQLIEISTDHLEKTIYSVGELIDTLRHEYAHIADYLENGYKFTKDGKFHSHSKTWKAWARKLGAKPFAYSQS